MLLGNLSVTIDISLYTYTKQTSVASQLCGWQFHGLSNPGPNKPNMHPTKMNNLIKMTKSHRNAFERLNDLDKRANSICGQ